MKAHIGVDAETGLVHGVRATPANTHDLREAGALLHGGEEEVWADAGYRGIEKWVEVTGGRPVQWHVAMRPGRRRLLTGADGSNEHEFSREIHSRSSRRRPDVFIPEISPGLGVLDHAGDRHGGVGFLTPIQRGERQAAEVSRDEICPHRVVAHELDRLNHPSSRRIGACEVVPVFWTGR